MSLRAMDKKELEKTVARAVEIVRRFLPDAPYLYFPLLRSVFIWAVRRSYDVKEKVLGWKVGLEPEVVMAKPDDFVVAFFESDAAVARVYAEELRARDLAALRRAFAALYPVLGLDDPFLKGLFQEELSSGDFRRLVEEFEPRTRQALKDAAPAASSREFWRSLGRLAREAGGLGIHLLRDEEVQDLIIEKVKSP